MVYKIITGDRLITTLIYFLLALGLWLPAFLSPEVHYGIEAGTGMPMYSLFSKALGSRLLLSKFVAFGMMLFEAVLLVRINTKFMLVQQKTFLPAFFYILFASVSPALMQLNPVLPAAIFVLFTLEKVLRSYKDKPNSYRFFEAGILLGTGSLFYAPILYLLVFLWIANMVQRPFFWREYLFPLLGLAIPYVFVFAILFLSDKSIPDFLENLKSNFIFGSVIPHFQWIYWILAIIPGFVILLSSIYMLKVFQFRKIYMRDYYKVLFWLFITSSFVFMFLSDFNPGMSYIIGISISYLFTNYFINARKTIGNKGLLYIMPGVVIILVVIAWFS